MAKAAATAKPEQPAATYYATTAFTVGSRAFAAGDEVKAAPSVLGSLLLERKVTTKPPTPAQSADDSAAS